MTNKTTIQSFYRTLCFLAAVLFPYITSAQITSPSEILRTAETNLRTQHAKDLETFALDQRMRDPLVRQIALRLGINGSALGDTIYGYLRNEDTYQLQVGFNSLRERKRQRDIQLAMAAGYNAESKQAFHEALAERAEALGDFLFLQARLHAGRRLDSLLQQAHNILREMLTAAVFEVKATKVLDIEEDFNRNRLEVDALENQRREALERIRVLVGNNVTPDTSKLLSIDDIRHNITRLETAAPASAELDVCVADIGLQRANLDYVNAQNRQIFNNVTVGYQRPLYLERPKKFNTFNNFNFRVGFTAPLPANNRFRRARAELDLREAQFKADAIRVAQLQNAARLRARLSSLFAAYDQARERLDNSLIRRMLDNRDLHAHITPLEHKELEIAQQKLLIRREALAAEIGEAYVAWCGALGKIEYRLFEKL